jgi:hypothetical protein
MIAFIMFNLFVLTVSRIVTNAAGFPRKVSVQGKGRVMPVTLRQLLILLSQNTTNRAVKQGSKSQLVEFTCINSKYKAVFIVESGRQACWLCGPPCTREANPGRWPAIDRARRAFPVPRFFLRERPH